ncbi:MAG: alpha-amylase family glycosyl hydrolase [Bacteroidota bacterium]|nr:alpha-amylase family glycosyl hydrolase [Bacteroidota bacterium]
MKPSNMMTYIIITLLIIIVIIIGYIYAVKRPIYVPPHSEVKHVDWSKNAVIYEVNIRQYSKQGTFKAFEKDLPRLKNLGVDILWIMPVNPIGVQGRKGPLGSYYAVKDYKAVNPEFGTIDDFTHLVKSIHNQGMKVILDWVPNHTSLDNALVKTHPEYFLKDSTGKFVSPFDWTDVIRLDYKNAATRKYMIETLQWWLKQTDLDGFRFDVAHMIPTDFWDELRPELEKVKPVFMLAEADIPAQHLKGVDMSYDWKFHHIMNEIAKGKKSANAIARHFNWVDSIYPGNSYLMEFTSNHDENSWNGTEYERMGQGAQTFAVLAATIRGMMLIYNGQEAGFNRRLKFFEKDSIAWGTYKLTSFYKTLTTLKKQNKALWNGDEGAPFQRVSSNRDSSVFSFIRHKDNDKVLVICNLSPKKIDKITLKSVQLSGDYREVFSNQKKKFANSEKISLNPWEYLVYSTH